MDTVNGLHGLQYMSDYYFLCGPFMLLYFLFVKCQYYLRDFKIPLT